MQIFCHRCGGELSGRGESASFCPHCGAPQLYLLDHLLEDAPIPVDGASADAQKIDWQMAIRCAAFVGLIAPVLCLISSQVAIFSLASFVWIVSGSVIAIGLYHRQRPGAYMDAGTGARIGVVVGLMMGAGLGCLVAVTGLIARFGLHTMAAFDETFSKGLHVQIDQMIAQMPSNSPVPADMVAFLLSPEVRAGLWLTMFALCGVMLLLLSTLGGAFAGFLRTRARTTTA